MTVCRDFINSTYQYGLPAFCQEQAGFDQGIFKGKCPVNNGIIIIMAFDHQGDLCANGIVGGLNKCRRAEHFFFKLNHPSQKRGGIFQAAIGGGRQNGCGIFDTRIPETGQSGERLPF